MPSSTVDNSIFDRFDEVANDSSAIKKGGVIIQKNKRFDFGFGTRGHGHELLLLAEQVGIPFSEDKKELLTTLVEFITWKGRYPVSWNQALYDSPNSENYGGTYVSKTMASVDSLYHSAKSLIFPGCGRTKWR